MSSELRLHDILVGLSPEPHTERRKLGAVWFVNNPGQVQREIINQIEETTKARLLAAREVFHFAVLKAWTFKWLGLSTNGDINRGPTGPSVIHREVKVPGSATLDDDILVHG